MIASGTALNDLRRRRPEWEPWLVIVEEILRETGAPIWDAAVPSHARLGGEAPRSTAADRETAVPLLAGATFSVQTRAVRRLLERLIRIGSRTGTAKVATLEAVLHTDVDVLRLFAASLCQDTAHVDDVAAVSGADAEALHAVVALLALPLLHACCRRCASWISESWVRGYCPVCASWPAFAEVRGIERSRYFRCSRCGGEWHARALHCPYCDVHDHAELVALVPEKDGTNAAIDACNRCRGYVKTFTRLQGCSPDMVTLEDLASVELDVAALEQGYSRPAGAGYPLDIRVAPQTAMQRFLARRS